MPTLTTRIQWLLVLALAATPANATVTYLFEYTSVQSSQTPNPYPSFSFSFDLPTYVTNTDMFALSTPFEIEGGFLTHAATMNYNYWVFGNESDSIGAIAYGDGPGFFLRGPSRGGYITSPGVTDFLAVYGFLATDAPSGIPHAIHGTGRLTVTETAAAVPEPGSGTMLAGGLLLCAAWTALRKR